MKIPLPALVSSLSAVAAMGVAAAVYAAGTAAPAKVLVINPEPLIDVPGVSSSLLVFDVARAAGIPTITGNCAFGQKLARSARAGDMVRLGIEIKDVEPGCGRLDLKIRLGGREATLATLAPSTRARAWSYLADLPDAWLETLASATGAQAPRAQRAGWEAAQAREILAARAHAEPYLVPVAGKQVPTEASRIPNARRPYRADMTDGVHHSWDFYAPMGTPVRAAAAGLVVRVRTGFRWQDFQGMVKKTSSEADRATNLDVLRGNQVWVKDAAGDLWMYNHLGRASEGLAEGTFVARGQELGAIGISGVPDKDYGDVHLDVSLSPNPRDAGRAGTWTLLDMMEWPWWGKGMGRGWVVENGARIFTSQD